jgi:hypothetical protein
MNGTADRPIRWDYSFASATLSSPNGDRDERSKILGRSIQGVCRSGFSLRKGQFEDSVHAGPDSADYVREDE